MIDSVAQSIQPKCFYCCYYIYYRERDIERCWRYYATSIYVQEKHQSQRCSSSNNNNKATKEREQQQQTPKKADGARLLWVMTFFFSKSTDEQNKTRSLQKSKDWTTNFELYVFCFLLFDWIQKKKTKQTKQVWMISQHLNKK